MDHGGAGAYVGVNGLPRDGVVRVAAEPAFFGGGRHGGGDARGRDGAAEVLRDEERERARVLAHGRAGGAGERDVLEERLEYEARGGAFRLAAEGFPQGLFRVVRQRARRRVDQLRDAIDDFRHLPSSAERSEAALSVAATTDAKSLARSTSMPAAVVPPGVATPEMKASRSAPDWRR